MKESVLCVRADQFTDDQVGYLPMTTIEAMMLLPPDEIYIVPRKYVEDDESLLQLIGYVTILSGNEALVYPRSGNEKRLHGLHSCGFGGHTGASDLRMFSAMSPPEMPIEGTHISAYETVLEALVREVREEVVISDKIGKLRLSKQDFHFMGLIRCNETPVDRVHLGLHFVLNVPIGATARPFVYDDNSAEMDRMDFMPLASFLDDGMPDPEMIDDFEIETWSQMCIQYLKSLPSE